MPPPPHSANRHDAGCGGAGVGRDVELGRPFHPLCAKLAVFPALRSGEQLSFYVRCAKTAMSAHISGELPHWPTRTRMAALLRDAGLTVAVGQYSIRVEDCSHFVFQDYGGDLGDPSIDADADSVSEMLRDGQLVSAALARAGIAHRFEIYDDQNKLSGYLHQQWPSEELA